MPGGPSERVAALENLTPTGELQFVGDGGSSVTCHGYLVSISGQRRAGTVTSYDPGGSAPLRVTWEDEQVSAARREHSNAATATGLLATPACANAAARHEYNPTCTAVRNFCATSTPLACSLYQESAVRCDGKAGAAMEALSTARVWKRQGLTAGQAARLIADGGGDADLAAEAAQVPDAITEQDFQSRVLRECLRAAAD
jgi:hypothetical protein